MRVRVTCKGISAVDKYNDTELQMAVWGENLHAPLVERVLELPMDIYDGACLTPRDCCTHYHSYCVAGDEAILFFLHILRGMLDQCQRPKRGCS